VIFLFTAKRLKKLAKLGLQRRYIEDSELTLQVRMMAALSFVPDDDIENA